MKQKIITASSNGVTDHICMDRRGNASNNYLLIIDMESGTGVVDFEFTPDDCIDPAVIPIWIQHDVLSDLTESCASTILVPFQAFRMNVKDYSGGEIKARVVQTGFHDY